MIMKPFRTILFAADFSENSLEAFRAACSLAVENQTRLVVLHVAESPWAPEGQIDQAEQPIPLPGAEPGESRHQFLRRRVREAYAPNQPIDVEYQTAEGNAAEGILRTAREIGSDLIVMGTHGLTSLRRLLAGSVAIAVLHDAQCPVLALRSGARLRDSAEIRVIVHPTDFSASSDAALQVARSLARDLGARLVLLHVAPFPVVGQVGMMPAVDAGYESDALEAARGRVDGPDLKYPVETWFCRGQAPDEIVRVAREVGCDLIVMGTHGRTGLGRLLMGNTAESVLPEANCPVIILKSPPTVSPGTAKSPAEGKSVTVF
jgi:nucleotide-binding universal stress UspA family protein